MKRSNGIAITEANRFSVFIAKTDKLGLADLEKWARWFASRDIHCVITTTAKGVALYRLDLGDDA